MKFTQRPLWALELLIAVLGTVGVAALAKHFLDRPRLEALAARPAVTAPTVPAVGDKAWRQHCQDAHKVWRAASEDKAMDPGVLNQKARSAERSCFAWQLARIESLLKLGDFDTAGQAWGATDRWHRQMLGTDGTGPRLQQVSELALQLAAQTRDWVARYPLSVDQLAAQAQSWPRQVVPAASDAAPDPVLLPTLTHDLELLSQAQSAWLHALRLPANEREAFVLKQPGSERFSVEDGKFRARSWRLDAGLGEPALAFEWTL